MLPPTPRQILLRRIRLHRASGEKSIARELLRRLRAADRDNHWPAPIECPPLERSLVDLDLPLRLCGRLERHGLIYARDAVRWSAERFRALDAVRGERIAARVRAALTSIGLTLRERSADSSLSSPGPLASRVARVSRSMPTRRRIQPNLLTPRRKQRIMELVRRGLSEREISRLLGYRSHTTVWSVKREMRLQGAGERRQST